MILYCVLLQAQSCLLALSGSVGWLCVQLSVPAGLYLKVTETNWISLFHAIKGGVFQTEMHCGKAYLYSFVLQHDSFSETPAHSSSL